jgi:hypothetical protein
MIARNAQNGLWHIPGPGRPIEPPGGQEAKPRLAWIPTEGKPANKVPGTHKIV